jgi:Predicted membrane protein
MEFINNLSDRLSDIFKICVLISNSIAVVILMWGVFTASLSFVKSKINKVQGDALIASTNHIKNILASYILLSLEILIASDIIESIIHPTFEDLLKLAVMVLIRTAMSYFLSREVTNQAKEKS